MIGYSQCYLLRSRTAVNNAAGDTVLHTFFYVSNNISTAAAAAKIGRIYDRPAKHSKEANATRTLYIPKLRQERRRVGIVAVPNSIEGAPAADKWVDMIRDMLYSSLHLCIDVEFWGRITNLKFVQVSTGTHVRLSTNSRRCCYDILIYDSLREFKHSSPSST